MDPAMNTDTAADPATDTVGADWAPESLARARAQASPGRALASPARATPASPARAALASLARAALASPERDRAEDGAADLGKDMATDGAVDTGADLAMDMATITQVGTGNTVISRRTGHKNKAACVGEGNSNLDIFCAFSCPLRSTNQDNPFIESYQPQILTPREVKKF